MTKVCKYCKVEQPLTEFYKSERHSMGCLHKCKTCDRAYKNKRYAEDPERFKQIQKKYLEKNPDARRRANLKFTYKITLEDYNDILLKQENCCAICKINRSLVSRDFDVDHCHTTGKIRGLLCNKCNQGLGMFTDDEQLLLSAANYLKNSKL